MSKPTRRPAAPQVRKLVKTSVQLDAVAHTRLAALSALRGVPITTILAEAVDELTAGVVVFDKRAKTHGGASSIVPGIESAEGAA